MKTVILHKRSSENTEEFTLLVDVNSKFMLDMDSYRISIYGWFEFDAKVLRESFDGIKISTEIPDHATAKFTFGASGTRAFSRELKTDALARIPLPFVIRSPWEWIEIID